MHSNLEHRKVPALRFARDSQPLVEKTETCSDGSQEIQLQEIHVNMKKFSIVNWAMLALMLSFLTASIVWSWMSTIPDVGELLINGREAYATGRHRDAIRIAEQVLKIRPNDIEAIVLGGGAAVAIHEPGKACEFYSRISTIEDARTANAACVWAHLLAYEMHHFSEAERLVLRVLNFDPQHLAANSEYANLLGLTGRRWEAVRPTRTLIRLGKCSTNQLILIGSETGGFDEEKLFQACLAATPDDPLALLGLAYQTHRAGQTGEARRLTERALELDPSNLSAQILLGNLLLDLPELSREFDQWHGLLPKEAEDHPEIWLIRGRWAQQKGEIDPAIRCYWEALRRNPNYRVALFQISQLLVRHDETIAAAPFLKRIEELQRLKEAEAALFEGVQTSFQPIQNVAEQLNSLGRYWEAWGWCQVALQLDPRMTWARQLSLRISSSIDPESAMTVDSSNPACLVDLSRFPLPRWQSHPRVEPAPPPRSASQASPIAFEDHAVKAGIEFTYFNGADVSHPGKRMFEFSGGGVGGMDYDLDGWCDLYLTQGCRWPVQHKDFDYIDRLYRNRGTGHFDDVTVASGLLENRFGQGLAIGDYNNDGYPDLYVGNIGGNRLFKNNGDGTFTETTDSLPAAKGRWTTSCAMADLNGDGSPDIYVANYLQGDDLFNRICHHKDGVSRMCAPFDFEGAPDEFYLSQNDGTFIDATAAAGFAAPHGKGLGLLIADYQQSGQLSVFVANDLVPNFYFANRTTRRGSSPQFEEIGLTNGVALNANGQAQGCMGIAADDFNSDGRLDLLVTNFYMETNALYLQDEGELFTDATAASGLVQPSLHVLGFGVQSIDADLDGIRDLVVTNGHVDDHRAYGQPYAMRPQAFRGLGDGRFLEWTAESIGPFFQHEYLGRGMARLDWNRDGREDLAISHLESPMALLTNTTPTSRHSMTIHLCGVKSDRDAIGATVTVQTSSRRQVRQLTAGDGYQSCNQRSLLFGLNDDHVALEVAIRWPTGIEQRFPSVPGDCEWLCIEGRSDLIRLYGTPLP